MADIYTFPKTSEEVHAASMHSGVASKSSLHRVMSPRWEMLKAVLGGTETLRAAGKKYTPKFEYESEDSYNSRLSKTDLTNVLEDAISNAVAKPFSRKMVLGVEADPHLVSWAKDWDNAGNSLHKFSEERFEHGISYGLAYILVDYPDTSGYNLTREDEKKHNIRPYCVPINAWDMLDLRYERIFGRQRVSYIRYKFTSTDYDGYKEVVSHKIREIKAAHPQQAPDGTWSLAPSRWKVFKNVGTKGWAVESDGIFGLDYVPIEVFDTTKKGKPFFMDLCYKNLVHWNSVSEQTNNLTRSRFSMLKTKGIKAPRDKDGNVIPQVQGPDKMWYLEPATDEKGNIIAGAPDADMSYIQAPTEGLKEGREHLRMLVDEMRMMGLDPLIPSQSGALTAKEKAMDEIKANSALLNWAENYAEIADKCFMHMAAWWSLSTEGIATNIFKKFGVSGKVLEELRFLEGQVNMGRMTLDTFYKEIERRHLLSPSFDRHEEIMALNSESEDS